MANPQHSKHDADGGMGSEGGKAFYGADQDQQVPEGCIREKQEGKDELKPHYLCRHNAQSISISKQKPCCVEFDVSHFIMTLRACQIWASLFTVSRRPPQPLQM